MYWIWRICVHIELLAMNNWKVFRRIIVEEAIRVIPLEVVIGLPPIGIADALGVDVPMLFVIAGISLSAPLVICVLRIVIRTRMKEEQTRGRTPWQMDKRTLIGGGIAAIVSILLAIFYNIKGLMSEREVVAAILITFLWIGMGMWFFLHRNR
jgi:hypothetical protein